MSNIDPTKESFLLYKALQEAGITAILEYWDGHKHVDIYVPKAKLYIEVDGMHHYTSVKQIMSDFQRDHYSDVEGFRTLRIPSSIITEKVSKLVKAVTEIIAVDTRK